MALPSVNFANIAPIGSPALRNMPQELEQGFMAAQLPTQMRLQQQQQLLRNAMLNTQNQYLPQQLQAQLQGQNLKNTGLGITNQYLPQQLQNGINLQKAQIQGQDITNQYAPGLNQAHINLLKGQSYLQNIKAQMGGGAPGPLTSALQLNAIKNNYGESSPQYQMALSAYQSQFKKSSSPVTKMQTELSDAQAGYMPGTGRSQRIDPSQQQQVVNNLSLSLQKARSDSATRNKALYAQNIDKTLNMINPDDLTRYAGLSGESAKRVNAGLAPLGAESKNYDNFVKASTLVNRLTTQVRQFYGDSIMPSNVNRLLEEFNTGTWKTNPALAKSLYGTLKTVLNKETGTYTDALQSQAPYQKNSGAASSKKSLNFNPATGGFE